MSACFERPHPDEGIVQVMAEGMHHQVCKCGSWPCRVRFRYDPTELARQALRAMLAAGYDWIDRKPAALGLTLYQKETR